MEAKEMAMEIARILDSKKARDLKVLEIQDLTAIADYFVLATGSSSTQVRALADEVEFKLKQAGITPIHMEGYDARNWVVMDYNTVVVHVFYPEARTFYNLESLWADGVEVPLNFEPQPDEA